MTIAVRIQLLAFAVVGVTAALVAPVIFWGFEALVERRQAESLDRLLDVRVSALAATIQELVHDVALLESLPALDGLMAGQPDIAAALPPARLKTVLAQVYSAMARAKPHYQQIRLIGLADDGRELVRVDSADDGARRVDEAALQQKGGRAYMVGALNTAVGETYVSRVELNRERGRIEQPERPTVRVARAVHRPDGSTFGMVVINVDVAPLFDRLFGADDGPWMVSNADGDYLRHPDPTRAFAFERGGGPRAQDDEPALAPLFAADGPARLNLRTATERVAWRRLDLAGVVGFPTLFVGVSAPLEIRAEADIANRALLGVGVALTVALLAGVLFGRRVGRPIAQMTRVAAAIGRGDEPEGLPVDRADEIGVLARAFEAMLARLAEKRADLEQANNALQIANVDLRQFAYIATHDLREPARRAAGIADLLLFDEAERVSAEGLEMLTRLQAVTENMLDRIADFRVLSNIGSGALSRSAVDLEALLDGVIAESAALTGDTVTVERTALPNLTVYGELLSLAWRNLIADLVRRARGRPITVTFGARPPRPDEISAGPVLTVAVVGLTMPADTIRGIFTRTARLRDSEAADGASLGLTVCRRIAERHGGWVTLTGHADHLEFAFSLGVTDAPTARAD